MKNINLFTAGQYVYTNIAIIKASNKFTDETKEFYIPFMNSEVMDFFENIPEFMKYFEEHHNAEIETLTIRCNGKDYEIF